MCALLFSDRAAQAAEIAQVEFNPGFLHQSDPQQAVDLSLFSKGEYVLPGTYRVDVYVNQNFVEQREVQFIAPAPDASAKPCIRRALLEAAGVLLNVFPALNAAEETQCLDVESAVENAQVAFDLGQQRLNLSIPQIALRQVARGGVDPKEWDTGAAAALLDYRLSASNTHRKESGHHQDLFLGLRSGINMGAWRLRHNSSLSKSSLEGRPKWRSISAYAERDITSWRSHLTLGDSFASDGVWRDGIGLRGLKLASDDQMLPDSLQGYAPVLRGFAQTNAKVEIRQNGYVIDTRYVAPGAFEIRDLYPASTGDLEVVVIEADGRETHYTQALSAVPEIMLREGAFRYQIAAGQYRHGDEGAQPNFVRGSLTYGLPHDLTAYTGLAASRQYVAGLFGAGMNLGAWGAVSVDLTHARTALPDGRHAQGQSWRALYAKSLLPYGTTFRLLGQRYSTSGYFDFSEAVQAQSGASSSRPHRRARVEAQLWQSLGRYGAFNLTANQQTYWDHGGRDQWLQLGYNASLWRLNYGVYAARTRHYNGGYSNSLSLSASMPLDLFGTRAHSVHTGYTVSHITGQGVAHRASASGTLLEQHNLNYGVNIGAARGGANGAFNLGYAGGVGRVDAGYSVGAGYQRASVNLGGGMVLHRGGLTLSQPLQDTIALVVAPGAAHVRLENQQGVRTDRRGYAVVPSLNPYRRNRIALLTEDLGEQVEIEHTAAEVVPTRGAMVRAVFETRLGRRMLITAQRGNGEAVPLGAQILDAQGKDIGIAGADGQVFVSGVQKGDRLTVQWGKDAQQSCQIALDTLPEKAPASRFYEQYEIPCLGAPEPIENPTP
ncbi:Fimbrial biogenesis outer membrane usher protein [Candidatus Glomeribacter gigasporarum BEG34]|uniref:Fimbrial biogenesis outer membrane usher protein n=1 Tax=Candidatus Glomeribacter gigasporarum BEG34 TaxID=1070319 RepID=G2J7M1_9BURK|nr:fimbria/pilus outer membrane usher protein [Candidatus Glomeribacter gigasporarum]CCD28766.1 Fimbrial biogenesis outer membrane usher protein [Candidatus Glomeribacter gigasporarum BEG34]